MALDNSFKELRLFQNLNDEQRERIAAAGETSELEGGDTVFEEGEVGTHVYCVLQGRIEISISVEGSADHVPVHTAVEGSVFGEFILFEASERSASARAVKPARLFKITPEALRTVFADDPSTGYKVMDNLCRILIGRIGKTTRELRSSLTW